MEINVIKQSGGALIVSLILLFAITLITVYSSRSAVNEQRLSKNEIKSIQALQASDAGLETMMANLLNKTQRGILLTDADSNGQPDGSIGGSIGSGDQTYHVTLSSPMSGDFTKIAVQSIGCSDACSGTCSMSCDFHRVVKQDISMMSAVNNTPNAPLITRVDVDVSSSTDVINNYSVEVIEYGGTYTDNGASKIVSNGVNVAPSMPAPPAVTAFSAPSPDDFFKTYFGGDKATIQSLSGVLNCSGGCTKTEISAEFATTQLVWASGDVTLIGGTYGTASDPVILIVDGNLEMRGGGGTTINGLVYVINPTWSANGAGKATINGAALAENNFNTAGNMVINYDPTILANLHKVILGVAKVSGSWVDF